MKRFLYNSFNRKGVLNTKLSSGFMANPFISIKSFIYGVKMVRLQEKGVFDHAIAVDAVRRLIQDRKVHYPMRFNDGMPRFFGGEWAKNIAQAFTRSLMDAINRS